MWRASRGAKARPPEARSGSQAGWDHEMIAVVRRGCAPRSADSVGWPVKPAHNQWKHGSNISGIGQVADSQLAVPRKWALFRRPLARVLDSARGERWRILPELFPWEMSLPWAPPTLSQGPTVPPERADRVRGSACAKGADASISRGLGTSATARIRNAGGRSTVGRRHGGRPNICCGVPSFLGSRI